MLRSGHGRRAILCTALTLCVTVADALGQQQAELGPAPELAVAWLDPPDLLLDGTDVHSGAARLASALAVAALSVDGGSRNAVAGLFHTQVAMSENGSSISLTVVSWNDNGYGDNTIVWHPEGLFFGAGQPDRTIRVTVTGIGGGPPAVVYDVIVIDPATVPPEIFDDGFEWGDTSAWSNGSP
jgi:hypothetical protein